MFTDITCLVERKERDDANAERDQLREQLKTVKGELVAEEACRARVQGRLNALLRGQGGSGGGSRAVTIQQLHHSHRLLHEQLMEAVQNDEVRDHRGGRYDRYAQLAEAEMKFWETMTETEGLITARHGVGFTGVY